MISNDALFFWVQKGRTVSPTPIPEPEVWLLWTATTQKTHNCCSGLHALSDPQQTAIMASSSPLKTCSVPRQLSLSVVPTGCLPCRCRKQSAVVSLALALFWGAFFSRPERARKNANLITPLHCTSSRKPLLLLICASSII